MSAFAQSSVTIYGRLNNGYTASKLEDKAGMVTKSNGLLAASWTSNRFGVNINEDLGNGMSAQGVWETGIGSTEAAAGTSTVRQAFVGLTGNGLGTIQAGAIYTPEYYQGTSVAGTVNSYGQTAVALDRDATVAATSTSVHRLGIIDLSNMVNYIAPAMGAVTLSAQVGTAGSQATGASGGVNTTDTKGNIFGLSANFKQGPLNATASYLTLKKEALAVTAVNATAPTGQTAYKAPVKAVDAADTEQKNTTLNATYDIGAAKLFALYANREMSGTTVRKYTTTNLGVNYTMGAIVPFASMSSGKLKDATTTMAEPKATQIGVNYVLSKRTNAYLYQASYKDDKALTQTSYKASQTNFGIAHTF